MTSVPVGGRPSGPEPVARSRRPGRARARRQARRGCRRWSRAWSSVSNAITTRTWPSGWSDIAKPLIGLTSPARASSRSAACAWSAGVGLAHRQRRAGVVAGVDRRRQRLPAASMHPAQRVGRAAAAVQLVDRPGRGSRRCRWPAPARRRRRARRTAARGSGRGRSECSRSAPPAPDPGRPSAAGCSRAARAGRRAVEVGAVGQVQHHHRALRGLAEQLPVRRGGGEAELRPAAPAPTAPAPRSRSGRRRTPGRGTRVQLASRSESADSRAPSSRAYAGPVGPREPLGVGGAIDHRPLRGRSGRAPRHHSSAARDERDDDHARRPRDHETFAHARPPVVGVEVV